MSAHLTFRRTALLALGCCAAFAAVAGGPSGCSHGGEEPTGTGTGGASLGIGDPCVPPDESDPLFGGFQVNEASVVVGDKLDCKTGICLVNHFQGRVTCPLGQAAPQTCTGLDDTSCGPGSTCIPSQCDGGASCAPFVCSVGACQRPGAGVLNEKKDCCVPGTTVPVEAEVCGQCDDVSQRNAADTVYCSCRCAPAAGAPPEPGASFCSCPAGFVCSEIQQYLGIGDPSVAGSYCIKEGSAFTNGATCGNVQGHFDPLTCRGVGTK